MILYKVAISKQPPYFPRKTKKCIFFQFLIFFRFCPQMNKKVIKISKKCRKKCNTFCKGELYFYKNVRYSPSRFWDLILYSHLFKKKKDKYAISIDSKIYNFNISICLLLCADWDSVVVVVGVVIVGLVVGLGWLVGGWGWGGFFFFFFFFLGGGGGGFLFLKISKIYILKVRENKKTKKRTKRDI